MEFARLFEDWTPEENSIAPLLLPVRRISVKNYLINSIATYTYDEQLEIKKTEFLKQRGGEGGLKESYIQDLARRKTDQEWIDLTKKFNRKMEEYSAEGFENFKRFHFKLYCNGGKRHAPIWRADKDSYDYTSQKLAVELLEEFNQLRQVLSVAKYYPEDQNRLEVEVEFIDFKNVGRYQAVYNCLGVTMNEDLLNNVPIKCVKHVNKIPILPLKDLFKILPIKNSIEFYPISHNQKLKMYCHSVFEYFNDCNGNQISISLSDCAYVLLDDKQRQYRCLPIFEILKPYLERTDFSKCTTSMLKDYEGRESHKYEHWDQIAPNDLKHSYDKPAKEIQFQICGDDRKSGRDYIYFVYEIKIKLEKDIKVSIREANSFTWRPKESLSDYE